MLGGASEHHHRHPGANRRRKDADHDMFQAVVRWVEQGIAPDRIIATKYVNDDPAQGVARTRPLCVYPKVAVYDGSGSTDDAANFVCRKPRGDKQDGDHDDDDDHGRDHRDKDGSATIDPGRRRIALCRPRRAGDPARGLVTVRFFRLFGSRRT